MIVYKIYFFFHIKIKTVHDMFLYMWQPIFKLGSLYCNFQKICNDVVQDMNFKTQAFFATVYKPFIPTWEILMRLFVCVSDVYWWTWGWRSGWLQRGQPCGQESVSPEPPGSHHRVFPRGKRQPQQYVIMFGWGQAEIHKSAMQRL